MAASKAWNAFETRMREIEDLGGIAGLLSWDVETLCPPKGRELRSRHSATLAALLHERVIDPAYGDAIAELAEDGAELTPAERAMVRLAERDRDRSVRLPVELVRALSEQRSACNTAWMAAREDRSFATWAPTLTGLVALKRQEAECLAAGGDLYDALLEEFEPGMTRAELDPLLAGLRADLVPFVQAILDRPAPDTSFLAGPFARAGQEALTLRVLEDFGFDFEAGRQDPSTHPFCGGPGRSDVRLTTRYYDSLEPGALFSTMHECGHGLYNQGMPEDLEGTVVAHAPSYGAHESQSRFWENIVGRSHAFWLRYLPVARELFPAQLGGVTVDGMVRAVNHVARTPVRVDADEVTYNLHILVRYELEQAIIAGELAVADLPGAWNERYVSYLGYTPKNDLEGVMQDVHWSWGIFGYFPSYTLGNLYAAALGDRIATDLDLDALVAAGEFAPILAWLRERVHARGSLLPAGELMAEVTGGPLEHGPFMGYLQRRYGALYGL